MPSPLRILLLVAAFAFLVVFVQLGILTIAFEKLGLDARSAWLLLMATLVGGAINLPLVSVRAEGPPAETVPRQLRELLGLPPVPFTGRTIIAVNVGGCVVPVAFSLWLLARHPVGLPDAAVAVAVVSAVSYYASFPIRGVGIGVPMLVAPVTAALVATLLDPAERAALAYVAGTLGVLIGADILRLREIGKLGAPIASIGGAGTFDGIFLSGLVAVLLA